MSYAGDVSPTEAWAMLKSDPKAVLVDVRTKAEWAFVGLPDLSELGRAAVTVEWQEFPSMARNAQFEADLDGRLKQAGAGADTPIIFICRSGARSQAAAIAMTAKGYRRCFNMSGGFEGDLDQHKHRGQSGGWKAAKLPWKQT